MLFSSDTGEYEQQIWISWEQRSRIDPPKFNQVTLRVLTPHGRRSPTLPIAVITTLTAAKLRYIPL